MLKALRFVVLATGVAVLPLGPAAAQAVAHDPNSIAGCYEITSGLPAGFTAGFCLDNAWQGEFTATSPAGACVRHMSWEATPDGFTPVDWPDDFIHLNIDYLGPGCPEVADQLTDDIYCGVVASGLNAGGLNCTFDVERELPLREVTVRRVN